MPDDWYFYIMKHILIILILICSSLAQAQKNEPTKKINCDSAMTQGEMNYCAANAYKEADAKLNSVYKSILEAYKSDTAFIHNLRISEQLWIKLRDAELKVKFPEGPGHEYGSVQPMCMSMYLTDLTNDRTKYLQIWLDGIDEGDACTGSVRRK